MGDNYAQSIRVILDADIRIAYRDMREREGIYIYIFEVYTWIRPEIMVGESKNSVR